MADGRIWCASVYKHPVSVSVWSAIRAAGYSVWSLCAYFWLQQRWESFKSLFELWRGRQLLLCMDQWLLRRIQSGFTYDQWVWYYRCTSGWNEYRGSFSNEVVWWFLSGRPGQIPYEWYFPGCVHFKTSGAGNQRLPYKNKNWGYDCKSRTWHEVLLPSKCKDFDRRQKRSSCSSRKYCRRRSCCFRNCKSGTLEYRKSISV